MDWRERLKQKQMGMNTERIRYRIVEGFPSELATFQKEQIEVFDNELGPITETFVTLYRLKCGHVVGTSGGEELLGKCQSCEDGWVCFRCNIRCIKCAKLLCTECVNIHELPLDGNVAICEKCERKLKFRKRLNWIFGKTHEKLSAKI